MAIIFKLRGGLGNQLFQSTAAAYFADRLQTKVILDDSAIVRHRDVTRRSWIRKIDLSQIYPDTSVSMLSLSVSLMHSFVEKYLPVKEYISERDLVMRWNQIGQANVFDWFQSSQYTGIINAGQIDRLVRGIRYEIRKSHLENNLDISKAAIHIRLGDFNNMPWGTLSKTWYDRVILDLWRMGVKKIDCYSDDIQKADKMLSGHRELVEINFPEKKMQMKPHELLWVLTKYRNFVSSNSSLSWWAAYLNQNETPVIFSPWGKHLHQANWVLMPAN